MFLELSIGFPNLGIEIENLGRSIRVFGIDIAYYGMIIALGMFAGYLVVSWQAKRTKQNTENYLDFAVIAIILSVIGARIYYVVFNWSVFKDNPLQVFNLRSGGLAIYGGVITATVTAIVFTRIKKINFWLFADTAVLGLLTGQIIGRWGNFFNREAFGGYTNNLFAMQLMKSEVHTSDITKEMLDHIQWIDGYQYIQVHPTFLYESLWNFALLLLLLVYSKHKKVNGEIMALYLIGYGLGRLWIEGLRTDQLMLWGTNLPISQLISGIAVLLGICIIGYRYKVNKK
ncbi:MAG: prolipoprotein diacylglyceryl transferase [bacterium]|nr:prolipoprotein diacylglyceryl transferase [bacterium]